MNVLLLGHFFKTLWKKDLFIKNTQFIYFFSIHGGSDGKESTCSVGDLGLIPGLGRSPGGGHGNPL